MAWQSGLQGLKDDRAELMIDSPNLRLAMLVRNQKNYLEDYACLRGFT